MSNVKESIDMVASIVDASPVGMLLFNSMGKVVFTNSKASKIFGYSTVEFRHINIRDLIPERFRDHHGLLEKEYFRRPRPRSMGSGRHLTGLQKDGTEIPIEVGLSPMVFGGEDYVLVSAVDLSDRIKLEKLQRVNEELKLAATHDALTGLPNRRLLLEFAANLQLVAMRNESRFTIMFIDLDGFKPVNDLYGHSIGDLLLCEVAKALKQSVRKSDIVGRYGGDEFLMCFADDKSFEHAEATANQILKAIQSVRSVDDHPVEISASIGVISTTTPGEITVDEIIQQADSLMYLAKGNKRRKIVTCDSSSMIETFFE